MKTFALVLVAVVLPTWIADAEQSGQPPKPTQKSSAVRPTPKNPCAQYGAGFAKIAGSDTCVKIGGSVTVEGGSIRQR